MTRQPSKSKERIKRAVIYGLMCLSIAAIVTALMLIVLGYSFNQKDNRLEQGGLLQFASVPSGATVTLDEIRLGSRTPSKVTADAATHSVKMDLKGYRTWQKSIDLKPGMIGWLSYARLVPTDIKAEALRSSPTLAGTLASRDKKWLALLDDATKPTIVVADIDSDKVEYKSLSIPETALAKPALTDKPQQFALESWSHNGQYLLVRHVFDDGKLEWLVVDRADVTQTKNVTSLLGINASKVVFGSENGRVLYVRVDDVIRKINLDDLTISRPLVENIDDFSVYRFTTLLYTTKLDTRGQRTVGYLADDMNTPTALKTFADDGQVLRVAMGEYFGKRYLAIQHGVALAVTTGTLPRGESQGDMKSVASIVLPTVGERLSIGSTGRFVIAESQDGYTVHDLELVKTDTTQLKGVAATQRPLKWLDPFMVWSDRSGILRLYEFDGANQQDVVPVVEGYDVTLSPNEKYLYSVGRDASGGFALQRVRMVLN